MGAGRSGTTLLATILGGSSSIITLGELHQFLDYVLEGKECSCGERLKECNFWEPVISKLFKQYSTNELLEFNDYCKKIESHNRILSSLFFKYSKYISFQENLFKIIEELYPSTTFLDSSKYISRYLQLRRMEDVSVKAIYTVRDVRGVINSFGKQVQTPKGSIATIIYYKLINFFGQIIHWNASPKGSLKLKYEDFVNQPTQSFQKIASFINIPLQDVITKLEQNKSFSMPHIIGGNRMKSATTITLKNDDAWKTNISRGKQKLYYLLTLPFMLLNSYKI